MRRGRLWVPMLLALLGDAAPGQEAGGWLERLEIVDRSIEHHGGEIYRRSLTAFELCSRSGCSRVEARVDGGLFDLRASAPVRGVERSVRITNDEVEVREAGSPRPVAAGEEQRFRDWVMARVYFVFLPYRLNDPSARKQDLGLETWGDRVLHKVKVAFEPGTSTEADDEYVYWFDPETARLEQFAYSYRSGGGGLRFRRPFNYRRVGGLLFFDQQNLGLEGADLRVDLVTPGFVEESMRPVSTIELRDIQVTPLARP